MQYLQISYGCGFKNLFIGINYVKMKSTSESSKINSLTSTSVGDLKV